MIPAQQASTANTKPARGLKMTLKQVAEVFDVSVVTVQTWRFGQLKSRQPLNPVPSDTRFVHFLASTVLAYAKRYDIPVIRSPQDVVDNWHVVKPGPKPKASATVLPSKTSKSAKKKPKH